MSGSKYFSVVFLLGLVASTVFVANAWRFVSSPNDRDAAPDSPAPLEYVKSRPFDALGHLALSQSLAADPVSASQALRTRALRSAEFLSPTDPQIVRAATRLAFLQGDVPATLHNLAKLAVVAPLERFEAFEALSKFVTHPAWQDFVEARLKAGWNDSDEFLTALCNRASTTGYSLFVATQFAKYHPIAPGASHCVERRAIASGQVQAGYQLRLNGAKTLPSRIGYVFNGDFESMPSGSPFDWTVEPGGEYREGFVAAIRPEIGSGNASRILSVRFTRRPLRSPIAHQILALPAARYQLSYLNSLTAPAPENAVAWKLTCIASGAPLIVEKWSDAGVGDRWVRRSVTFVISEQCPGQLLSLDPTSKLIALEGLRGTLLIDDIRVEKL